ncbi:hypothetical protein HYALB_00014037, partial [Hymenoscyphus albidus]
MQANATKWGDLHEQMLLNFCPTELRGSFSHSLLWRIMVRGKDPGCEMAGFGAPFTLYEGKMCKSAAISALNQNISTSSSKSVISEATVCCIALLLLGASIDGHLLNEVQTHRQGLSKIIALYGDMEAIYPSLMGFFQLVDVKSSLAQRTTPIFPLPPRLHRQFALHSQAPPAIPSNCSSKLGTSFFDTKLAGRISPAIYECICYTWHLMFIVEDYHTSRNFADLYDVDNFTTLGHILLTIPASSQWMNDPFNECLRLSLLIYVNTSLYKTPLFFGWMTTMLSDLRSSLLLLDRSKILSETPEIYLWMLILGGHLCSGQRTGMGWWSSRFQEITEYMGVGKFDDMVSLLQGVLFTDRSDSKAWRGVWNTMMDFSEEESLEG